MMDPRDFLATARLLARDGSAASCRSAISRSYYALYHVAFQMLLTLGVRLPADHRGHELVWRYLFNCGVDRVIHAGAQLRRLQTLRVKGDYDLRDPHPENAALAAQWIERTEQLTVALDAALTDPAARERMTRAIQAWEAARGPR